MNDTDRDRLIRKVHETFVEIPRPECTKRVAEALDDEWFPSPERVAELQRLDVEERWQDLKPEEMHTFGSTLFWMSPEGFRFYFPAFLCYTIANWDRSHDRAQSCVMEVIGLQPSLVESLTATEALVSAEILTELSVDPGGEGYLSDSSIQILENHAKRVAAIER